MQFGLTLVLDLNQESRYLSYLLAIYTNQLTSATIIIMFIPNPLPLKSVKSPFESNPLAYQEYLH